MVKGGADMARRQMVGKCPVCDEGLEVARLVCPGCRTSLEGRFQACRFCLLDREQKEFVEIFLRSRGNIKEVEREMGISYPTVRNRLDNVLQALGYEVEITQGEREQAEKRREILAEVAEGKLDANEAIKKIKALGG